MQQELAVLGRQLALLPGAGSVDRFADACALLKERVVEAVRQDDDAATGELLQLLRGLAAQGDGVRALAQRLAGGDTGTRAQHGPALLWILGSLGGGIMQALTDPHKADWVLGSLTSEQAAGLLRWPAAVLHVAEPVMGLLQHPGAMVFAIGDSAGLAGFAAEQCGRGEPYTSALEEVQAQLPALLRMVATTAGRMPKPGEDDFNATEWTCLLDVALRLLTAGGMAAHESAATEGQRAVLADCLLALLACLAKEGPPARCLAVSPTPEDEEQEHWVVQAWKHAGQLFTHPAMHPSLRATACSRQSMRLLGAMTAMLEQLQQQLAEQQQARHAAPAAPPAAAAEASQAQRRVQWAAVAVFDVALRGHEEALEQLAARGQEQQGQHADERALAHSASAVLWLALRALPPLAAILSSATESCDAAVAERCMGILGRLFNGIGSLLYELESCAFKPPCSQPRATQVLGGCEAALRCAGRLQSERAQQPGAQQPAAALLGEAAYAALQGVLYCMQWFDPAAEAAEPLLASLAPLAATACKCSVQCAAAAAAEQAAGAGQLGDDSTESQLLDILFSCVEVAQDAVAHTPSPTEQCQRLLRCVELQWAEAAACLLPLCTQDLLKEWGEADREAASTSIAPLAQQQGEEAAASLRALAAARRCCHMGCTTLAGGSEAELPTKRCSGCRVARFCSEACSRAAWRTHKRVCRQLAAEAAEAATGEHGEVRQQS